MITKKSSYSPPQTVPPAPAKPWSSKLKVYSYDSEGHSSAFSEPPSNTSTKDVVKLRDDGGSNGG